VANDANPTAIETAVPSARSVESAVLSGHFLAAPKPNALRTARTTAKQTRGFTLPELLVTVGVLVLLVLLFTQLLNSAATITTLGHKQMDVDSQARQLLDRMAIDFAQMVKRSDVDFFAKGTVAPNTVGGAMTGNDRIAFYSGVPGYYPSGSSSSSQSPVSLVAYRVNSDSSSPSYNKMERLGKGLLWNAVTPTPAPVVFLPLTIGASATSVTGTWPAAVSSTLPDTDYEVIGPKVFRFEYCYLLRSNGNLSITPPSDVSGIAAIIADIAVIDSKSKVLLSNTQLTSLAGQLSDYAVNMVPGQLRNNWQNTLNGITNLPRPAISGIRLYERFFYLSPPTL
jgi:prepilin-type N-terminal cleavage/methylation domain-containing protein